MLRGKMNGSIQESVHAIEDIHKDKVIPFENTDDRYKKLIDTYYDEWKSFGDGFADFWDVVCDIGSGLFGAVKDLFVGVIDLLKGVVEIAGWLLLKVVQADKIGLMPEALEEDVTGIFTGIGSILKDPGNALEAMGQSTFDNADEKGIAYSVSYIAADTAIGIFLDKGLKKLGKADDLVKPAGYSDEAADAAKYGDEAADAAMEAAERGDELAKGAEEAAGYADEGGSDSVRGIINQSDSAKLWGILDDGTNQGVKHFSDYWEKYPERIPSLEQRLGLPEGTFSNTLEGFDNFTSQAQRVISEAISIGNVRIVNGKSIYYIDGVTNVKKGVVVIVRDGKIQSMMPSDFKSFNKLQ